MNSWFIKRIFLFVAVSMYIYIVCIEKNVYVDNDRGIDVY